MHICMNNSFLHWPSFIHMAYTRRTSSDGHFKLFLNGCESCDKRADKYTCGTGDCCDDRQMLAEIFHVGGICLHVYTKINLSGLLLIMMAFRNMTQSVRRVKEANADMRGLTVKFPTVHEDTVSRDVWWYVLCIIWSNFLPL